MKLIPQNATRIRNALAASALTGVWLTEEGSEDASASEIITGLQRRRAQLYDLGDGSYCAYAGNHAIARLFPAGHPQHIRMEQGRRTAAQMAAQRLMLRMTGPRTLN